MTSGLGIYTSNGLSKSNSKSNLICVIIQTKMKMVGCLKKKLSTYSFQLVVGFSLLGYSLPVLFLHKTHQGYTSSF